MQFGLIKGVVSALVLVLGLGVSVTAFANTANFKKIERQLTACQDNARVASAHNFCVESALAKYEKQFNKSQKARYKQHKEMCLTEFGDPEYLSAADGSDALDCMHKAAKAVAKKK